MGVFHAGQTRISIIRPAKVDACISIHFHATTGDSSGASNCIPLIRGIPAYWS